MKNDEIKEILDKFKDYNLTTRESKLLLDYITNLQQENFNLRENILIHKMSFKSDDKSLEHLINMPSYEELQQENERLKEANVYCNRTDCVGRIKDSRKYDSVYQEKEDYKSRCEKAVEYIKNDMPYLQETDKEYEDMNGDTYFTYKEWDDTDLLNILQNGDEK